MIQVEQSKILRGLRELEMIREGREIVNTSMRLFIYGRSASTVGTMFFYNEVAEYLIARTGGMTIYFIIGTFTRHSIPIQLLTIVLYKL